MRAHAISTASSMQLKKATMMKRRGACLLLYIVVSWSFSADAYSTDYEGRKRAVRFTRRTALTTALRGVVMLLPQRARAACLMGDTSPDCIGVYKMPMDDSALNYVDTPEKLLRYAPDVRWVPPVQYPKSYAQAKTELESLQTQCAALDDAVLKGNLTEVGMKLLGIVPRLTVDGRVVIRTLNDAKQTNGVDLSMKAYRAESAHNELLNKLGQCDILIGQAIKGQLGAPAPAQLQILSDIKEANALFDEFLKCIPNDFKPKKG